MEKYTSRWQRHLVRESCNYLVFFRVAIFAPLQFIRIITCLSLMYHLCFKEQLLALVFITDSIRHNNLDNMRCSSSETHHHNAIKQH